MNRFRTVPIALAGALLLGAWDIPTEAPILEQRWVIPVEKTTLGVDELLPDGVTVVGSNFSVSVDPFTNNETLNILCASCGALNGLSTPVPAFNGSFSLSGGLPADVSATVISSGAISIQIQNGFSFDPIAGGGSLTVTLRDGPGGAQLGQTVFSGSLPANGTTTQSIAISSATIGATFFASIDVTSPGGQVATMDISERLTATATTTSLLVSSVTVNVASQAVDLDPVDLDVEDIDADLTNHIISGSVILDVVNPFGVSISGTINIGPIAKSLAISANGTSQVTISYTGEELRSFLGQANVQFSGSGTASGGSVTVSPGQEMSIEATLDFTISIG